MIYFPMVCSITHGGKAAVFSHDPSFIGKRGILNGTCGCVKRECSAVLRLQAKYSAEYSGNAIDAVWVKR